MTKHTPGPWQVCEDPDGTIYVDTVDRAAETDEVSGELIEVIVAEIISTPQAQDADARLVAAAPDLRELLAAMVEENEPAREDSPRRPTWERAKALLASL